MDVRNALSEGLSVLGHDNSEVVLDHFMIFKTLLLEWNSKINLTTITDEEGIVYKHFLDSLTCLSGPVDFKGKKVLDLGTGAGFPGVPIKIVMPELNITLMDSLNKRIQYLNEVCSALDMTNVTCVHARAEEAARKSEYREEFDIVVSRAVANMSTLAEYCLPFVKVGGYFVAQKTNEAIDEIKAAEKAIKILGGDSPQIIPVTVPGTELGHNLVVIKKIKMTPSVYPRKAGTPAKKPIV
ncbi:16S rRNA (guanine(527)-N(7))-methyltransferase RsmG [Acidaminobacter hydrogenoformans]|uniref:Ribosomal RNA small subunit methyltransferase G n=1 Tax=Acidaminobacter hydrogenoformans DSM 2784 TaxID=1120920 RepID=A0A1G5RTL4_9FIRM|nr:16S rRNA (guanine(527)-N(7))-methyltransferase RsmG [Acidaminobacter hydrogenoformans]SCZ76659.1 16S rRNA (guanine527-N7)-methyltransferase [Acidaminobacter hydrogenoformans DSM 2784]